MWCVSTLHSQNYLRLKKVIIFFYRIVHWLQLEYLHFHLPVFVVELGENSNFLEVIGGVTDFVWDGVLDFRRIHRQPSSVVFARGGNGAVDTYFIGSSSTGVLACGPDHLNRNSVFALN